MPKVEHYIDIASLYIDLDPSLSQAEKYKLAHEELQRAIDEGELEIVNIEEN